MLSLDFKMSPVQHREQNLLMWQQQYHGLLERHQQQQRGFPAAGYFRYPHYSANTSGFSNGFYLNER